MQKNTDKQLIFGLCFIVLAIFLSIGSQAKNIVLNNFNINDGQVAAPTTVLAVPVLSANVVSQSSINLSWSNSGSLSSYSIERSIALDGPFSVVTTTGKGVTSYTDNNLSPSTIYYYRVRAMNRKGKNVTYSEYSKVISAKTLDPDTSSPVISITSPQDGQVFSDIVTINSNASDNIGVTKVELWKNGSLVATDSSSPYSFTQDISVNTSTKFSFQTKAFDAANNVGLSLVITITANPLASTKITADNVLVVYNTNSSDSNILKDYYIANRPEFSNVNVLGIPTDDVEIISQSSFATEIRQPIVNWLQANTTKQIYYIVLLRGIPDRVSGSSSVDYQISNAFSDLGIRTGTTYGGNRGSSYQPSKYLGTTALVTHLNMGSLAATQAYIDKLKATYNAMPVPDVVISGQAAGIAGTKYYLDEAQGYSGYPLLQNDQNRLLSTGVISSRITYTPQTSSTHITQASDVLGYETWGSNGAFGGNYANDGKIIFSGLSSWFLIKTVESYNGQWSTGQGNFIDWFSNNAFGGTNYSNTPVGATTHVEEPYVEGVAGPAYLSNWEKGLLFIEAAWDSRNTPYFTAVGDPLIVR